MNADLVAVVAAPPDHRTVEIDHDHFESLSEAEQVNQLVNAALSAENVSVRIAN